jgi:hypothetical protein
VATLLVNITHTRWYKSVLDACSEGWGNGRYPARPAYRVIATDFTTGEWLGEFTSASGGCVKNQRRCFSDLVPAEQTLTDAQIKAIVGHSHRFPFRRAA